MAWKNRSEVEPPPVYDWTILVYGRPNDETLGFDEFVAVRYHNKAWIDTINGREIVFEKWCEIE